MKSYVERLADLDPTDKIRYMPSTFTFDALYLEYLDHPETAVFFNNHPDLTPMSLTKMTTLFHSEFSDVKLPHHTRLGKCDECFELRTQQSKKSIRYEDRMALNKKIRAHLALVAAERVSYHSARYDPTPGTLSLIADGARPIGFPCLANPPKMFGDPERLLIPLYGIICHTQRDRRLFFSYPQIHHDADFVITAISLYLAELLGSLKERFPRKRLLIQLDNTTSQNKNLYLIGFAGLLVHLSVFEEVQISFLPTGHTHEVRN